VRQLIECTATLRIKRWAMLDIRWNDVFKITLPRKIRFGHGIVNSPPEFFHSTAPC